jgi:hypothetical protein
MLWLISILTRLQEEKQECPHQVIQILEVPEENLVRVLEE